MRHDLERGVHVAATDLIVVQELNGERLARSWVVGQYDDPLPGVGVTVRHEDSSAKLMPHGGLRLQRTAD